MIDEKEYTFLEAPRYSCALGGAYMTVLGMENVVPILHAGGGCGIIQVFGMAFAGYRGGIVLLEDILSKAVMPFA